MTERKSRLQQELRIILWAGPWPRRSESLWSKQSGNLSYPFRA